MQKWTNVKHLHLELYQKQQGVVKMTKQNMYLLEAFKSLGEIINHKDREITLLNYQIERLKEELESGGSNEKEIQD